MSVADWSLDASASHSGMRNRSNMDHAIHSLQDFNFKYHSHCEDFPLMKFSLRNKYLENHRNGRPLSR